MTRWQVHVSAIALATASGAAQAQTPPPRADTVVAPGLDTAGAAALYRRAVLANALPALLARLDAAARSGPPSTRARALLVRADVQWQDGALDAAAADADRALAIAANRDGWLLKARITDAQGRAAAAADLYARAAAATADPRERRRLELRVAMIAARRDPGVLVALGRAEPQPGRGRIAAVAALLDRPRDALALGAAPTLPGGRAVQQLQLAGWALAAGDPVAARDQAWNAFVAARAPTDRLYALAIVVEALRMQGDIPTAIAFLDARPGSPELDQAKVDLLLESGRADAALALAARSTSPELRERRLAILDMVGRGAEAEAEYRRRIAADPANRAWYDGLAAAQMGRGDEAAAIATYRAYLTAARGRPDAAIGAARQMVALGLEAPAIATIEARIAEPAMAVSGRFFLFETQAAAGRTAEAQQTLDDLQQLIPAGSARLLEVADGYERIGRQDLALGLLRGMEARGVALGYDQRLHLADLALASAQPQEALPRLRALWTGATLPARRNYLARRIVAVARKLGTLPALEAQLQTRLTAGTITADELDLLVELQLALNRGAAAEATVAAYSARLGGSEAARLQRLLPLQARLGDQAKVERTLRRLLAIDPAHGDDYLRRLILIVVRARGTAGTPEERARQIDELVARMRAGDTRAFAAGVYAAASMDDRAIDAFRRAHAANPADGDDLLQLGNLLVRARRAGEASAILQYAAEAATTDAAFEQAISGLLDVFGAAGSAEPAAVRIGDVALQRAERLVLERMAAGGGDLRFHTLLAELARARGEFELERRTYDAALSIAGAQRPALLRQLIGLTSDNAAGAGGNGPAIGDVDRKTVYGRRLLALRQAYPPDFYADIARSLLARSDLPGAERAFALMDDQGGLVDLDTIRGEAYARTGHPAQALASYNRGLSRHRDDIDLTVRTAILCERAGQTEAAHDLYWRGLTTLLRRQPERGGAVDEARTLEMREFYATLVEGLLLTGADTAADAGQVDRLLAEAARQAGGTDTLAERPRLDLIVDLIRRIAEYRADAALAARLDAVLEGPFAGDPAYRRARDLYRHGTGLGSDAAAQASPAGTGWIGAGLRTQALDTGNFDLRLALAVAARNAGELVQLVDIAAANEPADGAAVSADDRGRPSLFYTVVLDTMDRLPRDMFERLVLSRLLAAPFRTRILFDIFRTLPDNLARLETIVGRPLLDGEALIRMTVQHSGDPLPNSRLNGYMRATMARYPDRLLARLSTAERITLYERLVDQARRSGGKSNIQGILLKALLDGSLDAGQQQRVAAAVTGDLDSVTGLQLIDVTPANRPILLAAADAAARQDPSFAAIPVFLRAWQAGDRATAFAALATLEDARSRAAGDTDSIRRLRNARFAAEQQAAIDAFLRDPAPTREQADRFYQAHVQPLLTGGGKPEILDAAYRKLLAIDADNPVYVAGMLDRLWTRDDRAGFVGLLAGHVARHPDDGEAATVLQLALRLLGQEAKAEEVVRATGADAADPVWIVQMVNRARLTRSGPYQPDFRMLFSRVFAAYTERMPQAAIVQQVARRGGRAATGAPDAGPFASLLRAPAADRPGALRQLWRESAGRAPAEGDAPPARTALLAALPGNPDAPADPELAAALTASPAITDELDRYLAAMPVEDRVFQTRMYDVLAAGLVGQQRAADRLGAARAMLGGGDIGDHDLNVLLVLADRTGTVLDAAQRAALAGRLRRAPVLSAWQRALAARAFLAAGDTPAATELLTAAAMQAIYTSPVAAMNAGGSVTGPREIVAELARWPDPAAARAAYDAMVARIGAPTGDPASSPDRLPPFPSPPPPPPPPATGAARPAAARP